MSLDKTGSSLLYFRDSNLQQTTLIRGIVLCNVNRFFLNLYDFKDFRANMPMKEIIAKGI